MHNGELAKKYCTSFTFNTKRSTKLGVLYL